MPESDNPKPNEDTAAALQQRYGVAFIDLASFQVDGELLNTFPEDFLRGHRVCPLFREGKEIAVAMVDPSDITVIDELRRITGLEVEPMVCRLAELQQTLNQYYKSPAPLVVDSADDEAAIAEAEADGAVEIAFDPAKMKELAGEQPVIRWVNQIISRAIQERASDIHIEPMRAGLSVRFRVDGVLHPVATPQKSLQLAVVSRIKIMSRMNIAERRLPQDGRYGATFEGREIDFRVATFPTPYGESVVMRILDRVRLLAMDQLGFSPGMLKRMREMISQPNGVILITGPTGSGKTTSLYAILSEIRGGEKKIVTVEDPIEYDLDGICQSQVSQRAGYTYVAALRSILRMDPDVIMVGEVRDAETAQAAIHAALTGQLVFSTLHTSNAPSTVARLVAMGVEPYLIASAVQGIVAQRLVRIICPTCKYEYRLGEKASQALGLEPGQRLYKGRGCERCHNTGYMGRIGIFEVLQMNDAIRDLIVTRPHSRAVAKLAQESGMATLLEDGIEKARAGITSVDEVMRETERPESLLTS